MQPNGKRFAVEPDQKIYITDDQAVDTRVNSQLFGQGDDIVQMLIRVKRCVQGNVYRNTLGMCLVDNCFKVCFRMQIGRGRITAVHPAVGPQGGRPLLGIDSTVEFIGAIDKQHFHFFNRTDRGDDFHDASTPKP